MRRLFPLIGMTTHPRDDAESPEERRPAEIRISLKDGSVLHRSVQHARGTKFQPFSPADLDEKFRDCTEGLMPGADAAALRQGLPSIESLGAVRDLMHHLRFATESDRGERFVHRPFAR